MALKYYQAMFFDSTKTTVDNSFMNYPIHLESLVYQPHSKF